MRQTIEHYGGNHLNYGDYPFLNDPHRCGNAPFVPNVSGKEQNSCGSYCGGFDDTTGCNKYLPNYPDDYYILQYYAKHGTCNGLQDCKNGNPPTQLGSDGIRPIPTPHLVENFGFRPTGLVWTLIYIAFLFLIGKCLFGKK